MKLLVIALATSTCLGVALFVSLMAIGQFIYGNTSLAIVDAGLAGLNISLAAISILTTAWR
jgi:hypothetical protein